MGQLGNVGLGGIMASILYKGKTTTTVVTEAESPIFYGSDSIYTDGVFVSLSPTNIVDPVFSSTPIARGF